MPEAILHDGSLIQIEIEGDGPAVLLPVNPQPAKGEQAETLRQYGVDPALGRNLMRGLSDAFRVLAFDYEGHVMQHPKPHTLTPTNTAADLLAVADAAGAERFAYYGYSWLAVIGLQLALRTDRLSALVMGGYPPLEGPYAGMLRVTQASYDMAGTPPIEGDEWSGSSLSKEQTRQFLTLYRALEGFDDLAIQSQLTCPRLCFAGSVDEIEYAERWGGVTIDLAGPVMRNLPELKAFGWDVEVLPGLDHIQAMQPDNVLPVLRPWLEKKLF